MSGGWEWRGVAGQLEHSLVKKSIKEKQRKERGERTASPRSCFLLQGGEQPQRMSARIIYRRSSAQIGRAHV